MEKTCSKCQTAKDVGDFYRDRNAPGGRTRWCKLCMKASNQRWSATNRERHRAMNAANYQQTKSQRHARRMERLRTDPKARLVHNLRARFHEAFKNGKPGKTIDLVGCSAESLRRHLEKQFRPGMTWDNYGDWHVDHIVPMANINIADPASVRRICHYTNLRPLWADENLAKGAR
jgi:hypothetical protein